MDCVQDQLASARRREGIISLYIHLQYRERERKNGMSESGAVTITGCRRVAVMRRVSTGTVLSGSKALTCCNLT